MALMMSFNEALFQSVPGVGILLGGAITALGSPRAALAVAGAGSLAITAAAWLTLNSPSMLRPPSPEQGPPSDTDRRAHPSAAREASTGGSVLNGAGSPDADAVAGPNGGPQGEAPPAPIGRHQ
jgi:hypothetical protein